VYLEFVLGIIDKKINFNLEASRTVTVNCLVVALDLNTFYYAIVLNILTLE